MKKKGRGAAKGSRFERLVCNELSNWWTRGKNDGVFWRTGGSGARATVRAKKGTITINQHGDVAAVDPIGFPLTKVFTISLKSGYSKDTIQDCIDKPTGKATMTEFIEEAEIDSAAAGSLFWMLITRRDRRHTMIWIPDAARQSLQIKLHPHLIMSEGNHRTAGFRFGELLAGLSPQIIRRLAERLE